MFILSSYGVQLWEQNNSKTVQLVFDNVIPRTVVHIMTNIDKVATSSYLAMCTWQLGVLSDYRYLEFYLLNLPEQFLTQNKPFVLILNKLPHLTFYLISYIQCCIRSGHYTIFVKMNYGECDTQDISLVVADMQPHYLVLH